MGFNFNIFGEQRHREFNYKPRYYDPEAEERKRIFGRVDGRGEAAKSDNSGENSKKPYSPGQYIKGSLRDGNYSVDKEVSGGKTTRIIGLVSLILVFVILYFFAKFYMLILN